MSVYLIRGGFLKFWKPLGGDREIDRHGDLAKIVDQIVIAICIGVSVCVCLST